MAKKEPEGELFEADDMRGLVVAWLKDSTSIPSTYITKEGMAYLNGFLQSSNTIALVKHEKYDEVVKNYEELIDKYAELKVKKDPLYKRIFNFLF